MKNKYVYHSKLSEKKFREIIRLFAEDLTATQIANLTGLNRNTINTLLHKIKMVPPDCCENTIPLAMLLVNQ